MKDINKRFEEIIDNGIGGEFLVFCISICLCVIGMLGPETNSNQIFTSITTLTGIVFSFIGIVGLIIVLIKKDIQIATPFIFTYVIIVLFGLMLVCTAYFIDISKQLSYFL